MLPRALYWSCLADVHLDRPHADPKGSYAWKAEGCEWIVGNPESVRQIRNDKSASVRRSSIMPAIGLCSYSDLRAPPGVGGLLHRIAIASHAVPRARPLAC